MAVSHHAITFTKLIKLVINIIVCVLYRNGDEGYFLGASYNKNHDSESLAQGVFIGFLIYNLVTIVAVCLNRKSHDSTITETLMNYVGAVLWLVTGGVVMQFWLRFEPGNHFQSHNPKAPGISMGALSVINAVVYLGEGFLSYSNYASAGGSY